MYNIRNIYLDNVGYKDAWFSNLSIPLYEYSSEKVSNTVLSLTNGGGKTTILSLIFSCFVPEQRNFIQHLQKSAHQFKDYFDKTPGLILIELEKLAEKETNLFDEKFIIGQYVYINQTDGEPVRFFFSFNPDNYKISDIPTLGNGGLKSRSDLKSWLNGSKDNLSNFFWTSKQLEWKEWLNKNSVDTWLAQKQVDFCRSEGGIDRFMNFNSERDFLKEFFYMALPQEDTEDVRSVLTLSLNKLKKRPKFEAQNSLLNELSVRQKNFSKEAKEFLESEERYNAAALNSERLYRSFESDIKKLDNKIIKGETQLKNTEKSLIKREDNLRYNNDEKRCLNYLINKKELDEKIEESDKLRKKKNRLLNDENNVRAALIYKRIEIISTEIEELEKSVNEDRSLEEAKEKVQLSAIIYKAGLEKKLKKTVDSTKKSLESKEILEKKIFEIAKDIDDSNEKRSGLNEKKAVIESFDELRIRNFSKLVKEDVLEKSHDPLKRIKEIKNEINNLEKEKTSEIEKIAVLEEKIKETSEKLNESDKIIRSFESKSYNILNRINESDRLKKEICGNRIFKAVFGTDDIDPDNIGIKSELDSFIERKRAKSDSLLIAKENISNGIEKLNNQDSTVIDENTHNALKFLRENGIKSARIFSEFLSDHYKNDNKSIVSHICSDPGRYLGICVDDEELKKVKNLEKRCSFEKPVVVSPADTKISGNKYITLFGKDRITISKSDLEIEKAKLEKSLKETTAGHEAVNDEINDLLKMKVKIEDYILEFGEGRLKRFKSEYGSIQTDTVEYINSNSFLKIEKQKCIDSLKNAENSIKRMENDIVKLISNKRNLNSYISDYHQRSLENSAELEKIEKELKTLSNNRNDLNSKLEKTEIEIKEIDKSIADYNKSVERIENEISTIEYDENGKNVKIDKDILKKSEDELKSRYKLDLKLYNDLISRKDKDGTRSLIESRNEQLISLKSDLKRVGEYDFKIVKKISLEDENTIFSSEEKIRKQIEEVIDAAGKLDFEIKSFEDKIDNHANGDYDQKTLKKYEKHDLTELSYLLDESQNNYGQLIKNIDELKDKLKESYRFLENLRKLKRETALLMKNIRIDNVDSISNEFDPLELPESIEDRENVVDSCNDEYIEELKKREKDEKAALVSYNEMIEYVRGENFASIEPNLSSEIQRGDFKDSCLQIDILLEKTSERIESVNAVIDESQKDLDLCVDKLMNHTTMAFSRLKRAVKISSLPESIDKFGGEKVLKLKTDINSISQSARRQELENFVKSLVVSETVPGVGNINGDELTSDAITAIVKSRNQKGRIGISIIKLSRNVSYTPVEKVTGSGGESMTAALLLYLVMAQLRAESKGGNKNSAGGFLLMDNPFAKATKPDFVKAQVELANMLGFQLIYATGIKDLNAIAQFAHIVQLRPGSVNLSDDKINVDRVLIESSELSIA